MSRIVRVPFGPFSGGIRRDVSREALGENDLYEAMGVYPTRIGTLEGAYEGDEHATVQVLLHTFSTDASTITAADTGQAVSNIAGTWAQSGGLATYSANGYAVFDLGDDTVDAALTVDSFTAPGFTPDIRVITNWVDANNYVMAFASCRSSFWTLGVVSVTAGTPTPHYFSNTQPLDTFSPGDVLRLSRAPGNNLLSFYINNRVIWQGDVAAHRSATKHGFGGTFDPFAQPVYLSEYRVRSFRSYARVFFEDDSDFATQRVIQWPDDGKVWQLLRNKADGTQEIRRQDTSTVYGTFAATGAVYDGHLVIGGAGSRRGRTTKARCPITIRSTSVQSTRRKAR
jgi:hypothetical protein